MIDKVYFNRQPFEIVPNIFLLGGSDFFNLYLIRGKEKTVLVDLGVSFMVYEVINQIQKVGVKPNFLILTHPHSDHITGWNVLHEAYPEALLITGNKVEETVKSSRTARIISYEDKCLYSNLLASSLSSKGNPIDRLVDFKSSIAIERDTKIDLGEISINCVHVKGHSIGNIIIEVPERQALFVSDSLGYQLGDRHIPMFLTCFNEYLNTIEKIASFNSNLIGPSHYGPFIGSQAKDIIQFAKEETVSFCRKINCEITNNNLSEENIFHYINIGLLNKMSRKGVRHCAKLLMDNAKIAKLKTHGKLFF